MSGDNDKASENASPVDDLLAMLRNSEEQIRWHASRSLVALGSEMEGRVIDYLLANTYEHAKSILQKAGVRPERIASAVESLVLKNDVFPGTAGIIAGPPTMYLGEQIRKSSDEYVVANCGPNNRVHRFSSASAAAEHFVNSEFLGRDHSPGWYMQ